MSINELEAKARELMEVRKEIEELEAMKPLLRTQSNMKWRNRARKR